MPHDNSLGSRIKRLRLKLGEPQASFATRTGHAKSLISRYEQNKVKKPNPQVLLDLAKALKVSPEKLASIQDFQPILDEAEFDKLPEYFASAKDFGSKLRDLRLSVNIGQKALAKKLCINRESIRRYERNITRPSKEILSSIVDILKTSSKELQHKYYHKDVVNSSDIERSDKNEH